MMKKFLANIIARILMHADDNRKVDIFRHFHSLTEKATYDRFRKRFKIAPSFRFNGSSILFYGEGEIICGKNSYIGSNSTIQAAKGHKVIIGDDCAISHNVRIYTLSNVSDADFTDERSKITGDVIIGNAVWIGANVFIKEGITIGDNAIVGANSVVTKNIEPFSICGGVPAKVIRKKQI